MKRIVLLIGIIISVLAIQSVFGQASGVITYEVKQNMWRNLPKEREDMKAMIPEYRTSKQQLFFNEKESLYKPLIEDEEEDMVASNHGGGPGGGIRMNFQMPSQEIYYGSEESKAITSREFNGKQYIINDSLVVAPWKFGTETKTIMGYECKQAYYTTTSEERMMRMMVMGGGGQNSNNGPETRKVTREITAWYTDKIRPSLGPERYYSLPGTILAIDVNNGEQTIVATKVDLRALKKTEQKMLPTKGEVITQKDFRKLVDEQMQRMRQGGGMMIRN